jgi:hypothetical protein
MSEILELEPHQDPASSRPQGHLATQATSPAVLLQIAVAQGADLDRLERLMALQERWEANEAKKAFDDGMAAFKGEAVEIIKRKLVDFTTQKGRTTYKHAELSDVVDAVAGPLSKHGFSWKWSMKQERDWLEVTCVLTHKAGHSESVTLGAAPDQSGGKNSIQAVISTKTYLERHTLKAITGVAEKGDDDDGQGAEPLPDPLEVWSGRAALAQTIEELQAVSRDGQKHFRGAGDVEAYKLFASAVQARGAALRAAEAAQPSASAGVAGGQQ